MLNSVTYFLFLCLIHLFLFIAYRQEKANLYISLYSLCLTPTFYLDNISYNAPVFGESLRLSINVILLLMTSSGLFSLLTIYSYLKTPKRALFWSVFSLIAIGYPLSLYSSNIAIFYTTFGYSILLCSVVIWLSLRNYNKNKSGIKFILIGWGLYILFAGIFHLIVLNYFTYNLTLIHLFSNLATLSVPICYSLMLASDTARTNKKLANTLIEVENLSNEKQQILANENETLEKKNIVQPIFFFFHKFVENLHSRV